MPRRNQSHKSQRRSGGSSGESRGGSLFGDALAREEPGPAGYDDERFMVRQIPGARATKSYRCPDAIKRCAQVSRTSSRGQPTPVAPTTAGTGTHGCWAGRRTRGLTRRWS